MPSSYSITPHQCRECHKEFHPRNDAVKHGRGLFCGYSCAVKNRKRRTVSQILTDLHDRLDKSAPPPIHDPTLGNCWIFTGGLSDGGYGKCSSNAVKEDAAHRLSYALKFGPIPKDVMVLHKCDVRRCCRPSHLYLGDVQRNMDDREAHGKSTRGTGNGRAKLTENQVREIRRRRANGEGIVPLSREFGVTNPLISAIAKRKIWKHVA